MSSELQRQVSSIRKKQLDVQSLQQGRPSLFLTAAEAAGVDVTTIQEAAHGGLTTLQQYDSRFEAYLDTLLHPSTVDLQRETKTAAENKALDVEINGLLKLLSLYAVEAASHLVLEYLIRRYRVHEMNTHELLQAMLVAHDTKIFARIVQLCKLEDSPWAFLQGVKTSGVPLPRAALVQRALKDAQLLEILSQYVQSAVELAVPRNSSAHTPSSHSITGANQILSFYTAVVLEMAEERPFDDVRVRHVYLFLVEGLKNKHQKRSVHANDASNEVDILDQWRRACCMILVQLSLRTPFAKPLVKVVSSALSESFARSFAAAAEGAAVPAVAMVEVVSTMSILAQQQKLRVGSKVLNNVISTEAVLAQFLGIVSSIKQNYNTAPLVSALASSLVAELCQGSQDAESEAGLTAPVLSRALCLVLSSDLADATLVRSTLTALLSAVRRGTSKSPLSEPVHAGIKSAVQAIAQRFAADFEQTVEAVMQNDAADTAAGVALTKFLSDVFSAADLKHHKRTAENGGGLLLSLSSAIPTVRAQAMSEFAGSVSLTAAPTADILGLVQAATQNLLDPIADVAAAAWTVPVLQRVTAHIPSEEIVSLFQTALAFWTNSCAQSPELAGKLVRAIIACLEDSAVVKRLLSGADGAGAQWLLQSVLPVALGALSLRGVSDELAASAARALKSSAVHHTTLAAFGSVAVKSGASQEAVAKAVTAAATSVKFLQQDGALDLLAAASAALGKNLSSETAATESAVVFTQLLLAVSAEYGKKGKTAEVDRNTVLRFACPLFLSALRKVSTMPARGQALLLQVLEAFVAQVGAMPEAPSKDSVSASVQALASPVAFSSLGYRILVAVLSSGSTAVTAKLGVCLQALQPSCAWFPLLKLVVSAQNPALSALAPHADNQNVAADATVHVAPTTRTAALHALCACLHGLSATMKTAKGKTLGAADSHFVVLLVAVSLHLCREDAAESRHLGLLLAERLLALAPQVALAKQAGGVSSEDVSTMVRAVSTLLTSRAAIIAVEPFAASAALNAEIFQTADASKRAVAGALMWLAAEIGWSSPQYSETILAAARGAPLGAGWGRVRTLLDSVAGDCDASLLLAETAVALVKLGYAASDANMQAEIVATVVKVIATAPTSKAGAAVKQHVVALVESGAFASAAADVRTTLYDALMREQISRPGQHSVLAALQKVQVSLAAPAKLLTDLLAEFHAQYQKLSLSVTASSEMEVDDAEAAEDRTFSGLSAPLAQILSVLEAAAQAFANADAEADGAALGALSAKLFDFLAELNDPRLRAVMLVDYCKSLAMDSIHAALTVVGKAALSTTAAASTAVTPAKKGAAAKKVAAKDADASTAYSLTRVDGDIRLLLNSITSTKATQVQAAVLKLLKVLLALNPASVVPAMQTLGELLATASAHMQVGKDGLIEQILRTFVTFLPETNGASAGDDETSRAASAMPQCMLQSLCQNFYPMPHHRRSALLKMALSAMKSPATLAAAADVLLVHSFVAHEMEVAGPTFVHSAAEESPADVMILLSKSANRRANREMKSSVPEELFNLATELMLMRTPNTQVNVVISLLTSAHRLLDIALTEEASDSATTGADELDVNRTIDYCSTLLTQMATGSSSSSAAVTADRRGHAATIAILHLELIIEILENKTFHQMLVGVMDAQAAAGYASVVQEYFMSFADGVLQLLAMASAAEQGQGAHRVKQLLNLRVDGTQLRVSPKAIGKHISSWCYEALRTLQKLMDGPSFVAIIQELIDHEQMEVRQKALVILGERLEGMTATKLKNDTEIDLYLDLNAHLRQVVQTFRPLLKDSADAASSEFHQQSGLAQSALMCIDVLARFLGKRLDWGEILSETLREVVEMSATLATLTGPVVEAEVPATATPGKGKKAKKTVTATAGQENAALQSEYCKLLGSTSLCAATLCSVLGAPALPFLPTIMAQNLGALEHTGAQVVAGPVVVTDTDAGVEEAQALWRTRVLLVRSCIAAVGIIFAQLSNFSHPYIPRTLTAMLPLEGLSNAFAERASLREDVDRCLSTLARKIPTRLSVPLLLQSAPAILKAGHSAACRFADLMAEVWQQLDRTTVVAHLAPLSTLATLLLDYRRVFGDQSPAAAEVDAAASDAVVELCLKLTESELKSFMTRLAEWRDIKFKLKMQSNGEDDPAHAWRRYARAVSYFSLADALMGKLKSIFIPIMGVLWGSAIDLLNAFAAQAAKAPTSSAKKVGADGEDGNTGKKDKNAKRKAAESVEQEESSGARAPLLVEFELLGGYILSSVRECCAQDTAGFVDEVRFEKMMQSVVPLLSQQRAFANEAAYLTYMEDYVGACLSALTVAVGRDLMWKPLNHKILMLTRDGKKAVRIAAVKVLHRLFSEVGDEYLMLLPECLPFLSELMEDSHRDVVAAASDTIKFIEELSGEKLDAYLQ